MSDEKKIEDTIDSLKTSDKKEETKKDTAKTKVEKDTKKETSKSDSAKKKTAVKKTDEDKPKKKAGDKKPKGKKKHNYILWLGLAVLAIPCLLMLWIVFGTMENTGEPVEGNRFEHDLDPAITKENIKALEKELKFDNVESVSVNLISATLRVVINTNDDLPADQIDAITNTAYDKVAEVLPIKTYFTNKENVQMYDLEVHVYNVIPDETNTAIAQIYDVKSKTAAAEEPTFDVMSTPRNQDVTNSLLNPQPVQEAPAAEGE